MRWNHLPVAGGINDQDPRLIEDFKTIFAAKAKHEAEEKRKQEAESRRVRSQSRGRRRGR